MIDRAVREVRKEMRHERQNRTERYPMRIVLDTNILISALMSSTSPSAQLLALWRTRKIVVVTAAQQIEEIARVTRYPKTRTRIVPALSGRLVNRLRVVGQFQTDPLPTSGISGWPSVFEGRDSRRPGQGESAQPG